MVKRFPILPVVLLLPIIIAGVFGSRFYPHDPTAMNPAFALRPPAWLPGGNSAYLLGTDQMGRDLLSRLIEGAHASLWVAVIGVALAGSIGISLGMFAGYFGGNFDHVVMRIVDIEMSIPGILLMILLSSVLGAGMTTIIVSIAVSFWTGYARVIRGETLSLKQRDFVVMAKVTGCSKWRILSKHILPSLVSTILVLATLQVGTAIMVEAALTFLGLGLQPPATAWGQIISDGRIYMSTAWWIPTFPGLAIMLTVLGSNLLGDWLRDTFDPKLRQV
ncbi:MAG: ABC transporter permease [Chloroflexi bacterium]|nr:ABC transporter permease [Chloroflexota bacterium]